MEEDDQAPPGKASTRRAGLSVRKKAVFAGITCLVAFVGFELLLAAVGVEPLNSSRDPFLGFRSDVPLFVRQGDVFVTNEARLTYFNPQSFPVEKSPRAYRVFCLGGSTTFGRPYDDRTSYVGWLRELLRESDPGRDWQIVNCGGVSYASYRLAFLMDECVRYQPDLIIVYTGHNEFLEERTFRDVRKRSRILEGLYQVAARTRTATILDRVVAPRDAGASEERRFSEEVNAILDQSQGPRSYTRDEALRNNVKGQFRDSLHHICDLAEQADARVIFIKPAANLRSFSPFKSEHAALAPADESKCDELLADGIKALAAKDFEAAATRLAEAAGIDPQFAAAQYLAGVASFESKRFDEAKEYFLRAKDEDICPLRATTAIQDAMSRVAASRGAALVDFPRYLEQRSEERFGHAIVGDDAFLDHVHPTIDLHLELATLLAAELADKQVTRPLQQLSQLKEAVSQRVLADLNDADHAEALCNLAQVLSWAGKNDEALTLAELAQQKLPTSSYVVGQYGRLLEKNGRADEAFVQYRTAVTLDPRDAQALSRFGGALLQRNSYQDALVVLELAKKNTPDRAPTAFRIALHAKLGDCLAALGRQEEAQAEYQQATQLQPQ